MGSRRRPKSATSVIQVIRCIGSKGRIVIALPNIVGGEIVKGLAKAKQL